MPSILFVCTANQCRSPMAEGLLRQMVANRKDAHSWKIDSAGIWASHGISPSRMSQLVMKNNGIDISSHRSQPVEEELLKQFDLVLTMEQFHRDILRDEYSQYTDRIFMLSEMIDQLDDVHDPIGGALQDYIDTADNIERIITEGIDRICLLAIQNHQKRLR